jgi:fluoroacetyl-CoA thioesterase
MTAQDVGSGDVAVLATPTIVTLVERTAVQVLQGMLPHGLTTVGVGIDLTHDTPTVRGGIISVSVDLEPGTSRTLVFGFEARDDMGPVARGTHRRVIVDRARFMDRAETRRAAGHSIAKHESRRRRKAD